MNQLQKVREHFRSNKKIYLAFGSGVVVSGLSLYFLSKSDADGQPLIKVNQIAWRAESNPAIINLVERSTPSRPVHLVGTNLYFSSLSEAARETGHHLTQISKHVNGHIPDLNGDVFELLEKAA